MLLTSPRLYHLPNSAKDICSCRMIPQAQSSGRLSGMDRYALNVRLTPAARELLRSDEALILDWHRLAICCAGAGESSLYAMKEEGARKRKGLVRLKGEDPIYTARVIFPHLAGREVSIDARKILGLRRFTSDLPGDFGLRAIMGRLPEPDRSPDQSVS